MFSLVTTAAAPAPARGVCSILLTLAFFFLALSASPSVCAALPSFSAPSQGGFTVAPTSTTQWTIAASPAAPVAPSVQAQGPSLAATLDHAIASSASAKAMCADPATFINSPPSLGYTASDVAVATARATFGHTLHRLFDAALSEFANTAALRAFATSASKDFDKAPAGVRPSAAFTVAAPVQPAPPHSSR